MATTEPSDEPFLDTHVHFWDHGVDGLHWPWLEPGFGHRALRDTHTLDAPRYTGPEFLEESAGTGTVGLVHVGAADQIEDYARETVWLQGLGAEQGLPNAIVGTCLVGEPGAADLVDRHARHGRFRGIRDVYAARGLDPDDGAEALERMADLETTFEARIPVEQLNVMGTIARRWPRLTVVLGHACLPLERNEETRSEWSAAIRPLAEVPNIVCKVSAVAGASDPDWTVASIRPWILDCIEVFGADRCMFGSNWPIDRLVGTYPRLVDAYRQVMAECDHDERAALFHRTAERVYRLGPVDGVSG